jgi:hypothetical protein
MRCLLPVLTWLFVAVSHAQETPKIGIRALLLSPGGPTVTLHPMIEGKVSDPVTVGARGLSEKFNAPARQFALALPDQSVEIGFRSVGEVTLPAQGKDFILLLEPTAEKFKAHVIASRESRFVADSTLFFNASETPVVAALGSEKTLIKPRVAVFAKAPARGEKPFYQATLYQAVDGKPKPFFNSRWPHRDNVRCYAFIYRNEAGRLTYQAVDERLMPEAKEPDEGRPAQ